MISEHVHNVRTEVFDTFHVCQCVSCGLCWIEQDVTRKTVLNTSGLTKETMVKAVEESLDLLDYG